MTKEHSDAYYDYKRNDPDRENPFTDAFDHLMGESVTGKTPYIYESPDGGKTVYRYKRGTDPLKREKINMKVDQSESMRNFRLTNQNIKNTKKIKELKIFKNMLLQHIMAITLLKVLMFRL